jgi:predicted MFS family arabinose efflux permease
MTINPKIPSAELAVGWLTMLLVGTDLFVFSPLLPTLSANYNVSLNVAGLCVTIFSLSYMIGAPLFGHISDRVGKRRVLICCLLAFGTANLLTASAASFPWLLALRLFAGAAAAGISPSIYALVGDAAPPDRRATWLALTVSGLLVSVALGASPAALVGASFGSAPVFLALAACSLALVALNCWVWPSERRYAAAPQLDPLAVTSLASRLVPVIVWGTGLYGVYTYLGAGLVAFGFSKSQVAQAVMVYGCGAIAGALIGGRLADRLGAKYTAGVSLAGLSICFFLLLLALHAGVLVELAVGLSAAVAQLFFPAQQSGLANDFPARRGAVLAWNNSALFLGISLGSLVGGEAVAIGSFDLTLIVCAGIVLTGYIVNWIVVPSSTQGTRQPFLEADAAAVIDLGVSIPVGPAEIHTVSGAACTAPSHIDQNVGQISDDNWTLC